MHTNILMGSITTEQLSILTELLSLFYIAGKEAMKSNPGTFSVAASKAYKCLGESSKRNLLHLAEEAGGTVTATQVRKAATKLFKKIQSQVYMPYTTSASACGQVYSSCQCEWTHYFCGA